MNLLSREGHNIMIEVYSSDQTIYAQMIAQLLELHELHPAVQSAHLASMIGMSPLAIPCRVLVPDSEVEAATALITSYQEHPEVDVEEPTHCPQCQEVWEPGFEICWSCQHVLRS